MKKFYLGALALVTSLTLAACGSKTETSADKWTTYESEKSITIGFDETFVPMGFKDKSGDYVGFDIDLATAVFDQYGIAIKWQPINWDLKETELNNGKIDLIWNGYSLTEERAEKVLFTDPYLPTSDVIITKKSSGITSAADMADKTLGAQSGSSSYDTFLSNPAILKDIVKDNDATQYETFTQAFIDLKSDRIDGLLVDNIYANYYLTEEGELGNYNVIDISKEFQGQNFAVGARKSDKTLVENINKAFKKLYEDGKFQEISKKWFGEDLATEDVKN
ncbi:transporter substrate-binding domain-containing protein [Streptococcus entericus]|uniref:amino acid ABC transporter substrate-binding protein n=1 Tax=Streptococcus entericus TaxID=155680 RepID=UPI0003781D4B|nr:amino acid ABC transporter substrate-binding protein [Streptococcus entericus]